MMNDFGAGVMKLDAAITSTGATTMSVYDYPDTLEAGDIVECELELCEVTVVDPDLTITRGELGTVAATHVINTPVIIRPRYTNLTILDALNEGMEMLSHYDARIVENTEVSTVTNVEEYTITEPVNEEGELLGIVYVEMETDTTGKYRELPNWKQSNSTPPKLIIHGWQPSGRNLRITTVRSYAQLNWDDTAQPLDYKDKYDKFLVRFAAGLLMEQVELRASAFDKSAVTQTSDLRTRYQQIGRNMQTAAMAYLDIVTSSTSVVYRPSSRFYRL
jgi:hypothetical protein